MSVPTRTVAVKLFVAVIVAAVAFGASAAAADTGAVTGYPNAMASTGDSITRAFDTCSVPYTDCVTNSWSTGTNTAVNSQYERILVANPSISGQNFNDAKTGARMSDLNGQAQAAVSQGAQYVTVLMGANDVCTSSEATMTLPSTVASQLRAALTTLSNGLPDARIFVSSIPNVYHLWEVFHTNFAAGLVWGVASICQSLLVNPWSTSPADQARRLRVQQRTIDDNRAIAGVCGEFLHCRYDGGAAYNLNFTTSDVTTRDYFHPSVTGQAKAAAASWAATFDFRDTTAPVSISVAVPLTAGSAVALVGADRAALAGIEYRLNTATTWTRYSAPIWLPTGWSLTFRAVDGNGNAEASHTITG